MSAPKNGYGTGWETLFSKSRDSRNKDDVRKVVASFKRATIAEYGQAWWDQVSAAAERARRERHAKKAG